MVAKDGIAEKRLHQKVTVHSSFLFGAILQVQIHKDLLKIAAPITKQKYE